MFNECEIVFDNTPAFRVKISFQFLSGKYRCCCRTVPNQREIIKIDVLRLVWQALSIRMTA